MVCINLLSYAKHRSPLISYVEESVLTMCRSKYFHTLTCVWNINVRIGINIRVRIQVDIHIVGGRGTLISKGGKYLDIFRKARK